MTRALPTVGMVVGGNSSLIDSIRRDRAWRISGSVHARYSIPLYSTTTYCYTEACLRMPHDLFDDHH